MSVNPAILEESEDEGKGILRWELNLKPGKEKEIRYKYKIEYPTGFAISGLE